jgi:hypothetical protein
MRWNFDESVVLGRGRGIDCGIELGLCFCGFESVVLERVLERDGDVVLGSMVRGVGGEIGFGDEMAS